MLGAFQKSNAENSETTFAWTVPVDIPRKEARKLLIYKY